MVQRGHQQDKRDTCDITKLRLAKVVSEVDILTIFESVDRKKPR